MLAPTLPPGISAAALSRAARIELCRRGGLGAFFRTYFGHYMTRPASKFHEHLFAVGTRAARGNARWNLIGAKELAKSTIVTLATPIYAAAMGERHYIAVMSNPKAIRDHSIAIVRELTTNPLLLSDFGARIAPKKDIKNQTEEFNDDAIILRNDTKIRFLTTGQSLRGARHITWRPDLYIGDDLHQRRDFDSPAVLDRQVKDILAEAIACLDMRRSAAIILGNRADKRGIQGVLSGMAAWNSSRWPIVDPKTGETLWFTKEEAAQRRAEVGEYVWRTDYLCQEGEAGDQQFFPERFARFPADSVVWRPGLRMIAGDPIEFSVLALDPSRGFSRLRSSIDTQRARMGDPDRAAFALVCRGRSGRMYVPFALLLSDDRDEERSFVDVQLEVGVQVAKAWGPDVFVCESNGFMEKCALDLDEMLRAAAVPVSISGEVSSIRKETRILSLLPEVTRGELAFAEGLPDEYDEQWRAYRHTGGTDHDDGPDATEIAARACRAAAMPTIAFGPSRRAA